MIWPFRKPVFRVLMVCTANVCRSPAAEALLRHHLLTLGIDKQISVSSAGTEVGSRGRAPDPRVVRIAGESGVRFPRIRAQSVSPVLLAASDHIWVMEYKHRESIVAAFAECGDRVALLDKGEHRKEGGIEIPDPYFGSKDDVRLVLEHIDKACERRAHELHAALFESPLDKSGSGL